MVGMNIYLNIIDNIIFLFSNELVTEMNIFILENDKNKKIYINWKNNEISGASGNIGKKYNFDNLILDCNNSYDYTNKIESMFNKNVEDPKDIVLDSFITGINFSTKSYMRNLNNIFKEERVQYLKTLKLYDNIKTNIDFKNKECKRAKI